MNRPARFESRAKAAQAHRLYESREQSMRAFDACCVRAEKMQKADVVALALHLLRSVESDGIDYGEFQSAQAVGRYVRKAINALDGLSL
jgi:hypothetical protein